MFRFVGSMFRAIGDFLGGSAAPTIQALITWPDVIQWFTERAGEKRADPDNIAFTLLRRPHSPGPRPVPPPGVPDPAGAIWARIAPAKAPVVLIQGIFNNRTGEVVIHRTLYAERIDDEVAAFHAGKDMVVYQ